MLGEQIRKERRSQERSLADVARKAKISIATLSRIENDKQTLEIGTFLTLARVLNVNPADLLGTADEPPGDGIEPLVRRIAGFGIAERMRFWRELAEIRRNGKHNSRRLELRQLSLQVEEIIAQIDFLRSELAAVQKRLRGR